MNLLHLKYAVEVDKTRSITKAAENLYMGQPNLSRAIKELEESLGIIIFKRTSKGIAPTRKGEEFLSYAKSILLQIDRIESLYNKENHGKLIFNISVPRASYISHAFTKFVDYLDLSKEIWFDYKETNSMEAINNILHNNFNLGIIRYQSVHEKHFVSFLKDKKLKYELIWEFQNVVLMSKSSPLASMEGISYSDLKGFIEITHGDLEVPFLSNSEVKNNEFSDIINKRIFIYERGSQFDLLSNLPSAYMQASPIPQELQDKYGLVQKKCKEDERIYKDVLIYRNNYQFTDMDKEFVKELKLAAKLVSG